LGARGYETAVNGSASPARLRELVYAFGLPHLDAADGFSGGSADLNLAAAGPWLAPGDSAAASQPAAAVTPTAPPSAFVNHVQPKNSGSNASSTATSAHLAVIPGRTRFPVP
jgi:hypothetical protein